LQAIGTRVPFKIAKQESEVSFGVAGHLTVDMLNEAPDDQAKVEVAAV
jgi:hypothetical protein